MQQLKQRKMALVIDTNYSKNQIKQNAYKLGYIAKYSGSKKAFYFHPIDKGKRKLKVVCWWSGGITSAIACKLAIEKYGKRNCEVYFIDTFNEDKDTYRFLKDCEKWYGLPIQPISNSKYSSIYEVWKKFLGMNFANGAICSSELKRAVRLKFEKENKGAILHQVFGFEDDKKERNRAKSMLMNYPNSNPIFPLIDNKLTKEDCIQIVKDSGIDIPRAYKLGLRNNNCLNTGCVQAGIGYWQLMNKIDLKKYFMMGLWEHHLTNLKGEPVTICKDQSKKAKELGITKVFLIPHPKYPNHKTVMQMKGRQPKPLFECNGFCGLNDLNNRNETEKEVFPELF